MGLFDSTSKTAVTNTTTTNTEQVDKSGNTGFQDIGGNLTLSSTSHNTAIDAGAVAAGLNLGGQAIEATRQVNADSIELLSGLVSGALDNSKTMARDSIEASRQSTADAIAGFGSLAKATSASTDDRVGKVAMYAFAALAAVFVLPALFKGAKGAA